MTTTGAGAAGAAQLHYQQIVWQFDSDLPAPTSSKQLQVVEVTGDWLLDWIAQRHYLGYSPPGARLRLAVYYEGVCVGGMLWGRPAARAIDQRKVLELTRMYLEDFCPSNSESRVLGVAARIIRKRFPEVTTLLAYSDPAYGHEGTIYKAAGWRFSGATIGHPWSKRPDGHKRKNVATGSKLRWTLELREKHPTG